MTKDSMLYFNCFNLLFLSCLLLLIDSICLDSFFLLLKNDAFELDSCFRESFVNHGFTLLSAELDVRKLEDRKHKRDCNQHDFERILWVLKKANKTFVHIFECSFFCFCAGFENIKTLVHKESHWETFLLLQTYTSWKHFQTPFVPKQVFGAEMKNNTLPSKNRCSFGKWEDFEYLNYKKQLSAVRN